MTELRFTHIGGPTALLEVAGWRILTDPTFDAPGGRYRLGTGSASTKLRGPSLWPEDLGPIDVVLLSHDHHADNLDGAGRELLVSTGIVLTTEAGAARLGSHARGLRPWTSTVLNATDRPAITVTATPCRHGPRLSRPFVGDVVGFALSWTGQRHGVLWVSGDTVLYRGLRTVARRLAVDVAVLHLGRARATVVGPARTTMGADAAVRLCDMVQPRLVIPVHYEGWSHTREDRAVIEAAFAQAPPPVRDALRMATLGEPFSIKM
ncbi:MAG: MBL fold metallo-hydrolase [Acidimicrobiales bacterium]|nr:MBL fold metallo-hydrolase [Acidimicrobiales bacterium]